MLDLNATSFLAAATNLARLHQIFKGLTSAQSQPLVPERVIAIKISVEKFKKEADSLGARLSVMASDRLLVALIATPCQITVGEATSYLNDIESRFADYLTDIKMIAFHPQEALLLEPADALVEVEGFSAEFPNAAFETEEAAKCIAVGRYTAAVFHAMRMLEIGIRALSRNINIPDPTKPSERNWAIILKSIKERIDANWPSSTRVGGSEGAIFESLYASLDAVRNPWRNATMHVETIYAPHEALHIIRCSAYFLRVLSGICNESGEPKPSLPDAH